MQYRKIETNFGANGTANGNGNERYLNFFHMAEMI
jgi:hypothetical protein